MNTGLKGQIATQLDIRGNVGVQISDEGDSDAASMTGVRANFK